MTLNDPIETGFLKLTKHTFRLARREIRQEAFGEAATVVERMAGVPHHEVAAAVRRLGVAEKEPQRLAVGAV